MSTRFPKIPFGGSLSPKGPYPINARGYFESMEDALRAAKSAVPAGSGKGFYYIGQPLVVADLVHSQVYFCQITTDRTLRVLGSGGGGGVYYENAVFDLSRDSSASAGTGKWTEADNVSVPLDSQVYQIIISSNTGKWINLGNVDLSKYSGLRIIYGGDIEVNNQYANNGAMFYLTKDNTTSIGTYNAGVTSGDHIVATEKIGSIVPSGWWKSRTSVTIDLTGVDYNGQLYLTIPTRNPDRGVAFCIFYIEFIGGPVADDEGGSSFPTPTEIPGHSSITTGAGWYYFAVIHNSTTYPLGQVYWDGSSTTVGCDSGYKVTIMSGGYTITYKDGNTLYDTHTVLVAKFG